MRPEVCAGIESDLSAFIDGELSGERHSEVEKHLEGCPSCSRQETALRSVRKLVRVQAVEHVPDLTSKIMARIESAEPVAGMWRQRFRVAAVSAAAAALIVAGASLPFGPPAGDVARADEITEEVRAAARRLDSYRATFEISERGWHPDVPVRRMTATVDFRAPEDFRLHVSDQTDYPSEDWPANDVTLVATADRWWIEEPSSCPAEALPNCAAPTTWAGVIERRLVTDRQPFDGTSPLPTDIIVPLETLAGDGFQVLGRDSVGGRSAYRLQLEYRQAAPLIASLQAGGTWRGYHPLDRVDLWIDTQTWFPLRYEVRAGNSPDRVWWGTRRGLDDPAGATLLAVRATGFAEPERPSDGTFQVPTSGITRDGGFVASPNTKVPVPSFLGGLDPYRAGSTADGHRIATFTDGMEYLKLVARSGGLSQDVLHSAEEIDLGGKRFVYYLPATQELGRRLEIATGGGVIQMLTNLPRDTLLRVAGSLAVEATRASAVIEKSSGVSLRRVDPSRPTPGFVHAPSFLPEGYEPAAATIADARDGTDTYTSYFRRVEGEFDGVGIRIVQATPVGFLPPSSEDFVEVRLDEVTARWSAERGELEWIDHGTYRSVAVPSADLYTAVRIARSLHR